jgi:lysozyme
MHKQIGAKMKASQNLKELLQHWEGLIQSAYLDSGNLLTIGIGHLLTKSELMSGKILLPAETIYWQNGLTVAQAIDLLDHDLYYTDAAVNNLVHVLVSQNQYDALVSIAYNVGVDAFANSTLLRLLNDGQYEQVPAQFRRWTRVKGAVVVGLTNRREKEIALWLTT